MQWQADIGAFSGGRAGDIDDGDSERACPLRRLLQGDDVRTLAGLRDGDTDCIPDREFRAIDRNDGSPDRAARNAMKDLDEILEIAGRMIGTAARRSQNDRRWLVTQTRANFGQRVRIAI